MGIKKAGIAEEVNTEEVNTEQLSNANEIFLPKTKSFYEPNQTGLENAIADADPFWAHEGDEEATIILPPNNLIETTSEVTINKRVGFYGWGSRTSGIMATENFDGYVIKYTDTGPCRSMVGATIYCRPSDGDPANYPDVHPIYLESGITAWRLLDARIRFSQQPATIKCPIEAYKVGFDCSINVTDVSQVSMQGGYIKGKMTLDSITRKLYLNDLTFFGGEHNLVLKGCKNGKIDCTFTGIDTTADTYDGIQLLDDSDGHICEDIRVLANDFNLEVGSNTYRDCVRIGDNSDYIIVKNNTMRNAYGSNGVNNISGNPNGVISDNVR